MGSLIKHKHMSFLARTLGPDLPKGRCFEATMTAEQANFYLQGQKYEEA